MYGLDTVLAKLSTFLLWISVIPSVYMLSSILVPTVCNIGLPVEPVEVPPNIFDTVNEKKNRKQIHHCSQSFVVFFG
jgi:hypothetical protein